MEDWRGGDFFEHDCFYENTSFVDFPASDNQELPSWIFEAGKTKNPSFFHLLGLANEQPLSASSSFAPFSYQCSQGPRSIQGKTIRGFGFDNDKAFRLVILALAGYSNYLSDSKREHLTRREGKTTAWLGGRWWRRRATQGGANVGRREAIRGRSLVSISAHHGNFRLNFRSSEC